jgi:repressor LexA
MSRRQLTQKQHAFLEYLMAHVRVQKVWPTYREIVDHFRYRSPNSVTQNLQALAKKGYLRRDYNGYHLVDREGKDGSVPLWGSIRGGQLNTEASSERLSLSTLFPGFTGLHALHLDSTSERAPALREAQYVFMGEEPAEGDLAVVLHKGALTLRTLGADGQLTDPEGVGDVLHRDSVEVLGRFAGHAGPYGLVRYAPQAAVLAAPGAGAAVSFS